MPVVQGGDSTKAPEHDPLEGRLVPEPEQQPDDDDDDDEDDDGEDDDDELLLELVQPETEVAVETAADVKHPWVAVVIPARVQV